MLKSIAMKNSLFYTTLLVASYICTSCDPLIQQELAIQNESGKDLKLEIKNNPSEGFFKQNQTRVTTILPIYMK